MRDRGIHLKYRILAFLLTVILVGGNIISPGANITYASDVSTVLESYDSQTDIADEILPKGFYEAEIDWRNELIFKSIQFANDSYNMTAKANYKSNPDVTDEGIRFVVAKATDRYFGTEVTIEVNVRQEHVHVFARAIDGSEENAIRAGWNLSKGTLYAENAYAIRYENGKLWFYENNQPVYEELALTKPGARYINVQPMVGFAYQASGGKVQDFHLWGKGIDFTGTFPAMPSGNGDYAEYIGIRAIQGTSTELNNGVITNSKNCTDLIAFTKLPFTNKDTYAWSFEVNAMEATKDSDGVRPIIRADEDFKNMYQLIITNGRIIVAYNTEEVAYASYPRTLGQTDKFGMVVKPDSVSVWVNDVLALEDIPLKHDLPTSMGIKFENTKATVQKMHFYYTEPTPFVKPAADPVIPIMTKDMYNGAQYMIVMNGDEEYAYQDYQIVNYAANENGRYNFTNIPLPENADYTYRADVTMRTQFSESWRGPRLLFRTGSVGDYYVAFCKETVLILEGDSNELASYPMNMEIGKTYDVAINSNPKEVNVWVDGKLIFNRVPLSESGEKTKAKVGILFELCDATLSNIKIYGKSIVFNGDIFDEELHRNKWFNMKTVPEMPEGNKNYFTHVKLGGATTPGMEQAFSEGILKVPMSSTTTIADFVDQTGSHSLNGLKKSDTYVWSSKVLVNKYDEIITQAEGDAKQDAGIVFTFKNSEHPGAENENYRMSFCMLQDRLELQVWQNGILNKTYTDTDFRLKSGGQYKVDLLIGKTWAKVWVDDKLIFTAYDLPTYHLLFQMAFTNIDVQVSDIRVYQVEKDNAKILPVSTEGQANRAGNTLKNVEGEKIPLLTQKWKVALSIALLSISIFAIVCLILYRKKEIKKTIEEGESTI